MDPSLQPQPNYDFIMLSSQKTGRFGGGSKKQRIKVVALLALGLITIIVILIAVLGSTGGKADAALVDLAAYQTELTRIITIGTTDAQSSSVRATAQIASMSLSTELVRTQTLLKQKGIKLNAKSLAVYHSTAPDTQLADAKKANTFDDTYKQLFDQKMINYQKKLSEVYASQSNATTRNLLKDFNNQAKLLTFEYEVK